MKQYQVLQGKISSMGTGDLELVNEFDTLEEAKDYFNKIKNDKRSYASFRKSDTLETWLIKEDDWEDPVGYWNC